MNNYQKAIIENSAKKFLLGKENYFVLNKDWGGHDITSTQEDLREYAKTHGETTLYSQLNKDILSILEDDVTSDDLKNICAIFWWYFVNKNEEGKIYETWIISPQIKIKLGDRIKAASENKADLTGLVLRIKERFNYDLI